MPVITRRQFAVRVAGAAAGIVASRRAGWAKPGSSEFAVRSAVRNEDTVVRYPIHGDNWHMTWVKDGRMYAGMCDGYGLNQKPKGAINSRLVAVTGEPPDIRCDDLPGYPVLQAPMQMRSEPRYYGFGILAVDDHLYQFLSTPDRPMDEAGVRFVGAKLIYSSDNGATWRNQDGSTPVVWESWSQRSRDSLVFYQENQEAFSLLSVLQMGQCYRQNQDGYAYIYAPNGNTEGAMNQLVLFRVPKDSILQRTRYEYFCGSRAHGTALWSGDMRRRVAVHEFPAGWVNTTVHPWAWMPSVVYNAPLRTYMMASWGTRSAADGMWFGGPSYLGLWVAEFPWGPWRQILEEAVWQPDGDGNARAFAPQIAPKWISPDGRSFWLVWSDFQLRQRERYERLSQDLANKYRRDQLSQEDWARWAKLSREYRANYLFNVQRVDLTLS